MYTDNACIKAADGKHIGYGYGHDNARFVAAAPDMEKALEGAEKILDSAGVRNWAIGWKVALEDVRAALAKAKGE